VIVEEQRGGDLRVLFVRDLDLCWCAVAVAPPQYQCGPRLNAKLLLSVDLLYCILGEQQENSIRKDGQYQKRHTA